LIRSGFGNIFLLTWIKSIISMIANVKNAYQSLDFNLEHPISEKFDFIEALMLSRLGQVGHLN